MNIEMSKIIKLIQEGSFQKAELEIRKGLKSTPDSFDLNKALAIALLSQKKYNQSLIAYNKCYELNKNDYDVNVNLSLIFNKVQDYKNSLIFSEYALKINPNRPEVYHNLANSYLYIPDLDKAEKLILKSIELRGGLESKEILRFIDSVNIYTDILFAKGEIKKFIEVCKNILDSDVYIGDIFRKLLRNSRENIEKSYVDSMIKILNQIDEHGNSLNHKLTKAGIYSCLAEYYNKEDKNISEKYYISSNKIISSVQRESVYDRQNRNKTILKMFKQDQLKQSKNTSENLGEGLIFIIGMPRSGTTLVESILASSEDSFAGGEKVFFHVQCSPLIKQFHNNKELESDVLSDLGKQYLEIIDIQRKGKRIFIDKMPDNYLYYRFIKSGLPKAKFVHVYRDPWDNAISLFKQNFASELSYASSFFGIALEYANYENMMKAWMRIGADDILNVRYEDLVSNSNDIIQKLWDFCELSGKYSEERRKSHFAQTASKQQVTKGIYDTSVNKKEFEDFREDFFKDLDAQREFWSTIDN